MHAFRLLGLAATLGVAACAAIPPTGPSILALPSQGKDFATFQREDSYCQSVAAQQSGIAAGPQTANNAAVGSAAIGTLGGAAAGALLGAAAGNAGAGAAIGAGAGLVGGSAVGANNASATTSGLQQRFDAVYAQCNASYGNTIQPPTRIVTVPGPFYAAPPPFYGPYFGPPAVSLGFGFGPRFGYGRPWGHRRYW